MVLRKYVFKCLIVEKLHSLAELVAGITRISQANVQISLKNSVLKAYPEVLQDSRAETPFQHSLKKCPKILQLCR